MQKILMTGATGYIGRNLARYCLSKGIEVHAIVRPDSNLDELEKLNSSMLTFHRFSGNIESLLKIFSNQTFDVVFHLAALPAYDCPPEKIKDLIDVSITLGTYLLTAIVESKQDTCFINTGTYWQHYKGQPYNPNCLYSAAKQAFESMITYFTEAKGITAITLKLYDVYGPADRRPKLLKLLYDAAINEQEIKLSPGEQYTDMVFIEDVVNAYMQAAELGIKKQVKKHQIFHISSQQLVKLKSVVELYEKVLERAIPVQWGGRPYREREIMQPYIGSILPGWQPKINLEQGLKLVADSYQMNSG